MSNPNRNARLRPKRGKKHRELRRRRSIEILEQRQMLAANFHIDAPGARLELQRIGDSIQILDVGNNAAILNQIGVNDIDNRLIEINANSLTVDSEVELDGNSLSVRADTISVTDGGGIFTADLDAGGVWEGDSGNITLVAKSIVINAGSELRTRPEFGVSFQAGTIVLSAIDQPQLAESLLDDSVNPLSFETRASAIQITDADIVGHAVTITSVGASATRWDDLGGFGETIALELTDQLQTIPQLGISSILPLSGQVKSRAAEASLSLIDARIHSDSFVTLSSEAIADATNNTLAIGTPAAPTLTAIGFSRSAANASIELLGASEILAGGFVDIRTHADSNSTLFSRAEANSRLSSSDNVTAAFNLALAWNDLDSKINLGESMTIDAGGSVRVDAQGKTVNKVRAATSVFQDGTGGLSVAVGIDNSDVSADVKGTIVSRETAAVGRWEFAANDVDATTNEIIFRRPRSLPPLNVGQSITYTGPNTHGLIPGFDYIVDHVTDVPAGDTEVLAQRVRLVGGRTIDLNGAQTMPGSVHTLSRLQSIRFDASDVSIENDSITLADLPSGVTELTYLGPDLEIDSDAIEIGGLQQNQTYQVDRVGNAVSLRSLETDQRIDLTTAVSGEHGFYYTDIIAAFEPRSETAGASAVDSERDTIELSPGHGLQTGDLVWYETDPTRTVDTDIFQADTNEVVTTVTLPDAPIAGLANSHGYRVVVDPDSPNRIRLVTTLRAAERVGVVDLVAGGSGGWFVDSSLTSGIQVAANLDATNAADAGVSLSDNPQPWPEVLTGVAQGQIDKVLSGGYALINALRGGLGSGAATEGQNRTGANGETRNNYDLAGSIAVPIYFHEVYATIAPTAVLTSWSDLQVSASILERSTLHSSSSATRRGVDDQETGKDPSDDGNDTELSLAVGYGHYVNHASAVISDNAQTNAARNTAVTTTIDYPMLVDSALEAINPVATIGRLGLAGFSALNDGLLGLSNLLNVQANTWSGASGDAKVFGGAVVVTNTTNEAIARIGKAARVNQDDIVGFNDESVDSSVTVRSELAGSIIEAGQMAAINVGPQGLLEAVTSKSKTPQEFITQFINPFGVQGDNAIGGIAIITLADHRVIAEIDDAALVQADTAVSVDATSSLYHLSIVQTGEKTTSFGFSASIAASDIDITIQALVGEAVTIDADSLQVLAIDDFVRTNIVGAFLMGKQVGIGVSIGINNIDQTVASSIGREDVTAAATQTLLGSIDVSGMVDVKATSGGAVFSFVMAGAVQVVGNTNSKTATQTRTLGAIALDVPVAINDFTTVVDAFIDRQAVDAGHVSVEATMDGNVRAIVLGASIAVQGRAGNSNLNFAGVGAVAINTIDQHAAALIRESDVTTRGINATTGAGVNVVATENPTIEVDAGGLSLSASLAPTTRAALAATGTVAINDVTGGASAIVRDSTLDVLFGDVAIHTASDGSINSLALAGGAGASLGGTGVSGVLGGAGAGARNDVNKTRSAELLNSIADVGSGSLSVIATNQTEIRADAGGFGISVGTGTGGKVDGAIGIALAFNNVTHSLTAQVDDSTATADGDIVVQAGYEGDPNDPNASPAINAWALAADLGIGVSSGFSATLAGSGSGAHNKVNGTIEALVINDSRLTSQDGGIEVLAFDFTTIHAWTVGASLGAGGSSGASLQGAVGVSVAKNDVTRTIRAAVTESVLAASSTGEITVQSSDDATIHAVAVAANAGISGAKGLAAALTGGGADATNLVITNQRAEVKNSELSQASKITVTADSTPKIDASVYGFFVGLVGAAGPAAAAAIGASVANNLIGVDASQTPVPSGVLATVENSSAVATESIHVEAISSADVDSMVLVVGVAVAASGAAGISGGGSGARTRNRIDQSIHAKIIGDGGNEAADRIDSPLLRLQANDNSDIHSDSDAVIVAVVGSAASAGSLAVGVSLSENHLSNDMEASLFNVQNLQNSVSGADPGLLDIDAGQTATVNSASLNVVSGNAFSAGSSVALSGGGTSAENTIHNRLRASVDSSKVPRSVTVDAISNNDLDAIVKSGTASVSAAQLLGGVAAVGVVTASNTIGGLAVDGNELTDDSNEIIAQIRGSNLSGGSQLRVNADSTDDVNALINRTTVAATVGLSGAAGAAVDVIQANTLLASNIYADLRNSTVADWNSDLPIEVLASDSATVNSDVESIAVTVVGGFNAAGLSVSVASAEDIVANGIAATVRDSTLANLDGSAITAGLRVDAEENVNVTTDAFASAVAANASIGGSINGGGVIAYAEIKSATSATIGIGSVHTTRDIEVLASHTATANAKTHGTDVTATLIGIGAWGSFATSRIVPSGDASVSFTQVDARDLTIQSIATPHADATAGSLILSTGLAVGVSDATVELDGSVTTSLQNTALSPIRVRDLNLVSQLLQPELSEAYAHGSTGGILIGVDSTVSNTDNQIHVRSTVEDNSDIFASGLAVVEAHRTTNQSSRSSSVAGALVAVGVTKATTNDDGETLARIADGVTLRGDSLDVKAISHSQNNAWTIGANGGVLTVPVAIPATINTVNTRAEIGDGAVVTIATNLNLLAAATATFNARLQASAGGVVTGGGGDLDNTVTADVVSSIGAAAQLTANLIDVRAETIIDKPDLGTAGNVHATTGGAVAGLGVDSRTLLDLQTQVTVAANANLRALHSASDTADINLHAHNTINATDRITLFSGGLASGGGTFSRIEALTNEATVTIEPGAEVRSDGEVSLSARGGGDITIQSNSDFWGLATLGLGDSIVDIRPVNEVVIRGRIRGDRDVHLSAGTDTDFNQDIYGIESRLDTFAGSIIPVDSINASASLIQNNKIDVTVGGEVLAGGDLRMHAERFGDNNVIARMNAVNWVTVLAGAIDNAVAEGGREVFRGTVETDAIGKVTVAGTARTGILRNRILQIDSIVFEDNGDHELTIDDYVVTLADNATLDVPYQIILTRTTSAIEFEIAEAIKAGRPQEEIDLLREELAQVSRYSFSSLDLAIAEAEQQLAIFSDNVTLRNFYQNEITRLQGELAKQGLFGTPANVDPTATTIGDTRLQRESIVILVQPLVAQAGSVEIVADDFISTGTLDAPGDAKVEIINHTLAFVDIAGISIPENTGGVLLNGVPVTQSNETPALLIENTATTNVVDGVTYPWPSITISGDIENLGGNVTLANEPTGDGSITINATILAAKQTIVAGTGTVTINLPGVNTAFQAAGTAHANLTDFIRNDPILGNGTFKGTVQVEANGSNPNFTSYLNREPVSPSLIGNQIFISAEYINVNGLIQSGQAEYQIAITETTATEIEDRRAAGESGIIPLQQESNTDFRLSYDFDSERILVSEVRAGGGYIDLTGRITNTRNGQLQAFGGYASIDIDNQTTYDIQLNRLDVSQRGAGTVIIRDLQRGTAESPAVTIYRYRGDQVEIITPTGDEVISIDDADDLIYQPVDGLRYQWIVAQDVTTRTVTTYASKQWLGFVDFISRDPPPIFSQRTFPVSQPRLIEGSAAFFVDATDQTRYRYHDQDFTKRGTPVPGRSWEEWTGWFLWSEATYYNEVIRVDGTVTHHRHHMEADRPIDVDFTGSSEGEIKIRSGGDVFIASHLNNPTGVTSFARSSNFIDLPSVMQVGDRGLIGGREISVVTEPYLGGSSAIDEQFGTSQSPLLTDLATEANFDFTSSTLPPLDPITNTQPRGTTIFAGQRVLVETGYAGGGTPGAVYQFTGSRSTLDLSAQDYNDATTWVEVDWESHLSLSAEGNVFIREVRGDLFVNNMTVRVANLTAQGSLLTIPEVFVRATELNLLAETGGIGLQTETEERGFLVTANLNSPDFYSPTITAQAAEDIFFDGRATLQIQSLVTPGDVRFDMRDAFRVIDGNLETSTDERAVAEITETVWVDLQLTVQHGADDKLGARVEAFAAARTHDYRTYWQFRNQQADPSVYDPNFRVRLTDEERAFYVNEATITTLENSRTQQYHDLHTSVGSATPSFEPDYAYLANDADRAAIVDSIKVWTEDELTSLSPVTSLLEVSDTEFVIERANITARNVVIHSDAGVGSFQNGTVIEIPTAENPTSLSLYEQALIAAAEPDDFLYLRGAPLFISELLFNQAGLQLSSRGCPSDCPTWPELGFAPGDTIYIESNNPFTENRTFTILEETFQDDFFRVDGQTADFLYTGSLFISHVITNADEYDQATHLVIQRREDLDLDISGSVSVTSSRNIFLGSETDLNIGQIDAGTEQNSPRVQIKVGHSILSDSSVGTAANVRGEQIVLEASAGAIGTITSPLRLLINQGGNVIARADDEVVIQQISDSAAPNDFAINEIFSRQGFVDLESGGSIVDAFASGKTNIQAPTIVLRAGGQIGQSSNPLEIETADTGSLTATAGGDIRVSEATGNLNVRQVLSQTGDVELTADFSILDAIDVADPYDPYSADAAVIPGNPRADVTGNHIRLTAKLGGIGEAGNELDIDSDHAVDEAGYVTVRSTGNVYVNETIGDLTLSSVLTDGTSFIAAPAGSISSRPGGAPNSSNVTGKVWLFAADNVGTAEAPIRLSATFVEGQATTGDVYLQTRTEVFVGGVIDDTPSGGGEGEFASSRHGSRQGLSAGRTLSIVSPQTVNVIEGLSSLGNISITGRGASVSAGRWVQSNGDILFVLADNFVAATDSEISTDGQLLIELDADSPTNGSIRILGSVSATGSSLRGTNRSDTFVVTPTTSTGALLVETAAGDDTVQTNQGTVQFSGGDGRDLLKLIGDNVNLNLLALPNGALESIETIDLRGDGGNSLSLSLPKIANQTSATGRLDLWHDDGDRIDYGSGWTADEPILVNGEVFHVLRQDGTEIRTQNPTPYVNPLNRLDVNRSGTVTASDALAIINRLSQVGGQNSDGLKLPIEPADLEGFLYLDPNNDKRMSALDALNIINALSRITVGGESEDAVISAALSVRFVLPPTSHVATNTTGFGVNEDVVPTTNNTVAPAIAANPNTVKPTRPKRSTTVPADRSILDELEYDTRLDDALRLLANDWHSLPHDGPGDRIELATGVAEKAADAQYR